MHVLTVYEHSRSENGIIRFIVGPRHDSLVNILHHIVGLDRLDLPFNQNLYEIM